MAEIKKKEWSRTKAYKVMRDQMIADLETSGIKNAYFLDKVNRFMSLWCRAKELEDDLTDRGIRVEYQNGSQCGETDNKSLDKLLKVYRVMDHLHRQLGYQEVVNSSRQSMTVSNYDSEDDEL